MRLRSAASEPGALSSTRRSRSSCSSSLTESILLRVAAMAASASSLGGRLGAGGAPSTSSAMKALALLVAADQSGSSVMAACIAARRSITRRDCCHTSRSRMCNIRPRLLLAERPPWCARWPGGGSGSGSLLVSVAPLSDSLPPSRSASGAELGCSESISSGARKFSAGAAITRAAAAAEAASATMGAASSGCSGAWSAKACAIAASAAAMSSSIAWLGDSAGEAAVGTSIMFRKNSTSPEVKGSGGYSNPSAPITLAPPAPSNMAGAFTVGALLAACAAAANFPALTTAAAPTCTPCGGSPGAAGAIDVSCC
mmetsp:Transcript_13187/g.41221  ORF Transcript_13187/g.41221 Transcript_13187/m.41221 type:complete len:313 (+) Transcript_13187:1899-2837(+)